MDAKTYKDHGGAKNTPWPWWCDDDGFIAAGSNDSYVTVADVNCSEMNIDERRANAALIGQAPLMRALLAQLCEMDARGTTCPTTWEEVRALLHELRDEGA